MTSNSRPFREILSELIKQRYNASSDNDKKKKKDVRDIFNKISCPYCGTEYDNWDDFITDPKTGAKICPLCVKRNQIELGEYQ